MQPERTLDDDLLNIVEGAPVAHVDVAKKALTATLREHARQKIPRAVPQLREKSRQPSQRKEIPFRPDILGAVPLDFLHGALARQSSRN